MHEPPKTLRCPVCGSADLVPDLHLHDGAGGGYRAVEHEVGFATNSTVGGNRGGFKAEVRATVCGACGYTMLFARDYWVLWGMYRDKRARQP